MDDITNNKVWVKQSAIDALRKPKQPVFHRRSASTSLSVNASFCSNTTDGDSACDTGSVRSSHGRSLTWGWKAGTLIENVGGKLAVQLDDEDEPTTFSASVIKEQEVVLSNDYPIDEEGNIVAPHDLITLTHLHEPSVVESLHHRYNNNQIYTNTGPVLLALNPFQNVRGLYGESIMKKYWEKAERNLQTDLPPHVYAIADASFRNMMRGLEDQMGGESDSQQCNQSILVSGESGAGKTVTTKFVMKYLAALSQRSVELHSPAKRAYQQVEEHRQTNLSPKKSFSQPSWAVNSLKTSTERNFSTPSQSKNIDDLSALTLLGTMSNSIEAQVLQSNPILESFGNARTVRNDNSSRFGKFIEIQFTGTGKLVGAQIETYLLEKVRLVTQNQGERNYHIFYEFLSGAMDPQELSQYFIAKTAQPEDFRMTASGTYDRRDGVSDKETFRQLKTAMNTMKFDKSEISDILYVTAALLHASNLTFTELPHETSELDNKNPHITPVCHLLGVKESDLNEALCYLTIQAGRESIVRRAMNIQKAEKGLQALMKAVYGALFMYLVQRINDLIAYRDPSEHPEEEKKETQEFIGKPAASIGVLDIFGFESFTTNSFEQLCINYCNEALQQQFNAFVLKNEQAEYEREGIEWSFISFPENQDVLDLIEKRGTGILSILDDQCRAPGPSDKAFALDVYKQCSGSSRFHVNRKQNATLKFAIQHYAGPVEYNTEGFTEKNRDELSKEVTELLKKSESPIIQHLAWLMETCHELPLDPNGLPATPAKLHRSDASVGRATVGGQFRRQLRNLRYKIDKTSPHYVRCLKPNDLLIPDYFDTAIVAEQLRCGGILEAIRVARAGYTQHYLQEDFVKRYRGLAWNELSKRSISPRVSSQPKVSTMRGGVAFRNNYLHNVQSRPEITNIAEKKSKSEVKAICDELIKVLYRKILQQDKEDEDAIEIIDKFEVQHGNDESQLCIKEKKTEIGNQSRPPIHGGAKSRYTPWEKKTDKQNASSPPSGWKRGGISSCDYAKVGIQVGKTKVFLRHKAFESLERIRGREQTSAATKLNSLFRMYLARLAYIPYRDAFRMEMRGHFVMQKRNGNESRDDLGESDNLGNDESFRHFFSSAMQFHKGGSFATDSLVDKWTESRVRDAIHNPVPRHEWGKQAPSHGAFKWVLSEGIWIKNYNYEERD